MKRGGDPAPEPEAEMGTGTDRRLATRACPSDGVIRMGARFAPRFWPRALLLIAIGAAYANAFAASFQFDDWDVIVRDPRVRSFTAWWQSMPGIRPLLKLSYALNHASGLGTVGFHAVNVAIHAVNALLVLEIAGRLLDPHRAAADTRAGSGTRGSGEYGVGALVAAIVFALHPVQTEAVTYASGRSSSLSAGLALASLLVWARTWDRDRSRNRGGAERGASALVATRSGVAASLTARPSCRLSHAFSIGLMLLALAVKESAVVVPVLIAIWAASEPGLRKPWRSAVRACSGHALALLAGLALALALPAYRAFAATSLATRSALENLVAQVDGITYLTGQLVRFDRLNVDPALEAITRLDPARALAAAVIAAALVAALANLRRGPLAAFAVLWSFAWLAPTNSLVARLDLVNDRQLYAALLGPALLVALGVETSTRRLRTPRARRAARALACAGIALCLGLATAARNAVYRDELVFWQDVVRKSPHNARAFNNLGFARAERCELDAAAEAWRRALELDPELVRAAVNLRLLEEGAGQAGRCRKAGRASRASAAEE